MSIDTESLLELAAAFVPCVVLLFLAGIAAISYLPIRAARQRNAAHQHDAVQHPPPIHPVAH
jgi:hypothetical protein